MSTISKETSALLGGLFVSVVVVAFTRLVPVSLDVEGLRRPASVVAAPRQEVLGKPKAVPNVQFAAIVARPLFAVTRRPAVIVEANSVAEVKPVAADRRVFEGRDLVGIIESSDGPRLLIDATDGAETLILSRDEILGAWQFARLEGETAVFVAGDEVHRLTLKERSEGLGTSAVASQRNRNTRNRRRRP